MKVKNIRLFPWLYNIKDFLNQDHPDYHPDSVKYDRYWSKQERRCVEGMWGLDSDGENGGYRYMPGFLYYYVNFCIILDEDDKGNAVRVINPLLRDIEWMFSYGWLTARGFSGFDEDEQYTSHRLVGKLEKGEKLTGKEKINLQKIDKQVRKPDGTYKEYVESREYLYKTHNKPLGKPYYSNTAKNLFVLGPRGWGKSFFAGNAVIGHEYNFFGKKFYDSDYLINPSPVEIFVGSSLGSKSSDLLKKFSDTQEHLKKNYGSFRARGEEEFIPGFFYVNSSGSLSPNNAKSPYRNEYKYQKNGVWMTGGTGTKIYHGIYTSENPQAAVGTRPTVMVIEEVGLLGNLLEVQGSNETCQIRRTKFGSSLYIGTSGNMEKIQESKIVFQDPEAYNFIGYKDHWEQRKKPIGFFIPATYVDNDFKDENGNTDLDAALEQELHERKMREKADTSAALDFYIMSRPLVPSEMFLTMHSNIFPVTKLREREAKVSSERLWKINASIGQLKWDSDRTSVTWEEDTKRKLKPINNLSLDSYKGNINGAIVVYEHPPDYIPSPTFRKSIYKVTYDPIKDDHGGTSLASVIVHKGFADGSWNMGLSDTIVAEYVGRPKTQDEYNKNLFLLCEYYRAKLGFENDRGDVIGYGKRFKKLSLLHEQFSFLDKKELQGHTKRSYL